MTKCPQTLDLNHELRRSEKKGGGAAGEVGALRLGAISQALEGRAGLRHVGENGGDLPGRRNEQKIGVLDKQKGVLGQWRELEKTSVHVLLRSWTWQECGPTPAIPGLVWETLW